MQPAAADEPVIRTDPVAPKDIERFGKRLDLDAGQQAQLRAILDEERAQLREFMREAQAAGQRPAWSR